MIVLIDSARMLHCRAIPPNGAGRAARRPFRGPRFATTMQALEAEWDRTGGFDEAYAREFVAATADRGIGRDGTTVEPEPEAETQLAAIWSFGRVPDARPLRRRRLGRSEAAANDPGRQFGRHLGEGLYRYRCDRRCVVYYSIIATDRHRPQITETQLSRRATPMTTYLDNAATSFPEARSRLPGAGPLRPHAARQPRPGRAQDGPRRRAHPRRRPASAQPVLPRRGAGALRLHAQLHRRAQHGLQGRAERRRSRHHHRPGTQQRQPAAAGDGAGRHDRADARRRRRRRHHRSRRDPPGDHAEDAARSP